MDAERSNNCMLSQKIKVTKLLHLVGFVDSTLKNFQKMM